ncbi:phosphopantetheine-binding protein [uncultured Sneathiella sp.]|jgi:acyl carrier protein|uniref:phosphopantetheine-binding protein n=1 Tax=uncultured Sneathiella sp. TaxID=879315 RepID=UPI0030DA3071|tara:strand:+ start:20514 stop:20783 length:270 start_codon:yes stop_codon:yes gene_type:complete
MNDFEQEIKKLVIKTLNLEDITPEEIDSEERLFVDGLGLDSIDALELGVAIQKTYGIKINAKNEDLKEHFASVRSLASFIKSERKELGA